MKCPECSTKQKFKMGMKCTTCGYVFTLSPKDATTLQMTDTRFLSYVKAASQNGTAWFTENQLYSVICKRRSGRHPGAIAGGIIMTLFIAAIAAVNGTPVFGVIIGVIGLVSVFAIAIPTKTSRAEFETILRHWHDAGKTIDRLLTEPTLHEPPPDWQEPDIYDYGVQRLLIVQRDLLVDLFVKNGLHAEQQMLVISESGYPEYLLPVAQQILDEQPELPIFLLHDADHHGTTMQDRIEAGWVLSVQGHPVTDLGMFPSDFQKLSRLKNVDPHDAERLLPVDAMVLPFMTMGLTAAMTDNMSFGTMLDEQNRKRMSDHGSSFG